MAEHEFPRPGRSDRVAWIDLALAALLFGIALAYFSLSFDRSLELGDEGLILYHSARVAAGEVPYEDFPNAYGPGVFALTAMVVDAFDGRVLPVRVLLACFKALAVALTFLICRSLVSRPFATFGALLSMAFWGRLSWNLNTPYAALYAIPLCLLACFGLVHALRVDASRAYFVAGLLGGAPILFKQTLGVANAFGMVLAVCGVTALGGTAAERNSAGAVQFLVVWGLAGVAFLVPGWELLRASDYVLNFLPLHVFMGVVAAGVVRRGSVPLASAIPGRLAPLALGLTVLPGLTAAFYALRGRLQELFFNVVTLPANVVINYYLPLPPPPVARCVLLLSAVGFVFAGLFGLRGQWARARAVCLAAVVVFGAAAILHSRDTLSTVTGFQARTRADAQWSVMLWTLPIMLETIQPAVVLLAATAVLASWLLVGSREVPPLLLRTLVPLIMFQASMSFQVFPRGSSNMWLVQGAVVPLLTILLLHWYRVGASDAASPTRKVAAALLVMAIPVWMVTPVVHHLFGQLRLPGARPVALPQARGIALSKLDAQWSRMSEFEELVAFLRRSEPADAPVLPITTDLMMLYLSGRRHLFPQLDYYFFLLGLGMLPSGYVRELQDASVLRRLADTPSTLIVTRNGLGTARMLGMLWRLKNAIGPENYDTIKQIGSYTVLRRKELPAQ